ncbi:Armadillo [Macleaya cordata]|uniref:Armadillo n=1 Tax=Macleaya cordata TaxID=56857 RepID=A0A200RDJ6_MACCD|nr:Armadillo [Macleaya cordata]
MADEEKTMEEEFSYPILLADRIRKAVEEAESFKFECSEVGKQVDRLSQMLRSVIRLATNTPTLYERPVRRIISEVSRNLERALTLVRKCKRSGVFHRVVTITITSATDFRKLSSLLESSIGDVKWLLGVFDYSSPDSTGIILSLPPIASNDPILSWVWSYLAAIQMGPLSDRVEAANELASLALDNDRNKKIIVEEGGVPPLLKLLKEGASPDSQIAAATALSNLATDQERVRQIVSDLGVPIIVQVLNDSPMRVQISVANLVSRMAENDPAAQEEFAREKIIRPLVSLLSFDTFLDEPNQQPGKPTSFHSLVKINKELGGKANVGTQQNHYPHSSSSSSSLHSEGSSRGGHYKKERDNEKPEVKLQLKIHCAEALWMLSKGSISNSRRITETKGLLCLAKIIEKEKGELQLNCLMAVMEIAAAAESNADLRRAAFKTNSPAAKAIVEQLMRVIQEESSPSLQIPAIKSIGSLARTFPARETRVITPIVSQLDHKNPDVATEAAIALGKFACPENFLCVEHSKVIIEFGGITPLMRLLRANERAQLHGLILLCYLALHVGNSEGLERARSTLEGAARSSVAQHPSLRELIPKAISHLELYQAGVHSLRQSYPT